jgi:hypothetical protein
MSNNETWLVLSFAIMVVAVLATLYEKVEKLEKRLARLEGDTDTDDDDAVSARAGWTATGERRRSRRGL